MKPSTSGLFGCLCVVAIVVAIIWVYLAAGRRRQD